MKGLYRGFCRNEQGTETIAINGEKIKGEWVQGFLATECHIIDDTDSFTYYGNGGMDGFAKLVIPETVGQYTGLTANGKKVFEGDICQIKGISYIDETPFVVEWNEEYSGWFWRELNFSSATDTITPEIAKTAKIIGNIHDNGELLRKDD